MSARDRAFAPCPQPMPNRRSVLAGIGAALAATSLSAPGVAEEPVRVGMIPDAGATQVSIEQKAPLEAYLGTTLGRPVKLVIPTSYNATVEGLGNGSLDFAYLGGLTYVKAHATYNVVPLVQRKVDTEFHSLFITQADSAIHTVADLRGKTFAFGDINSTSGHLMPYREMVQAGLDPDKDLKWSRYTGSHAATVQAVAAGIANAGACDETVFHGLIDSGKVDGKKLRVFYTTPAFVDYVWVARSGLSPELRSKFADAFLRLSPTHDADVLAILRGNQFVAANDAEYSAIRDVATKLSMLWAAATMPALLEVENLEVRAAESGQTLLRGTSFRVEPGECVAVLGPSGSGKTTLFRAINGTVPASGGVVRFAGEDVTGCKGAALRRLRRRIAVIPQKHDLVEALRVHQNVTAGALGGWSAARAIRYLAWPTKAELATAEAALANVNLAHKLHARTRTLSGGEQQRVAIARALVQAPALIIADEPVASLDPRTAEEVLALLCGLAERSGVALLCSLHQPELASRFFRRVIEVRKNGAAPSVAVVSVAAEPVAAPSVAAE